MRSLSLYVHVPFCKRRCPYCTFYHVPHGGEDVERAFIDALLCEFTAVVGEVGEPVAISTLFFGGGTPSVLRRESLERVFGRISPLVRPRSAEVTVEANPEDVNDSMLSMLNSLGVNRLSLGIQSMNERAQKVLARCPPTINERAARLASRYFDNVSIDLLLGVPGTTLEDLGETLERIDDVNAVHVSVYCLEPEGDANHLSAGFFDSVNPERSADEYLLVCDHLGSRGYHHYEVSNFAKPGFESSHNWVYWRGGEYLGIGPGAHSYLGGERFFNEPSIDMYLDPRAEFPERIRQWETRGEAERGLEKVMLGLRTSDGLPVSRFGQYEDVVAGLVDKKLARVEGEKLVLTDPGFLVLNEIVHRFCAER